MSANQYLIVNVVLPQPAAQSIQSRTSARHLLALARGTVEELLPALWSRLRAVNLPTSIGQQGKTFAAGDDDLLSRRKATLYILALAPTWASGQPALASAERQLRSAIDAYLNAWARRDVDALSRLHTDDTLYMDPYLNEKRGRGQLAGYIGAMMRLYDLRLDIERIVVRADGTQAFVIFRERYGELPRKDGRYVRNFDRSGIFSRWRFEDGVWRIEQYIDSTTRSAEFMKAEGLLERSKLRIEGSRHDRSVPESATECSLVLCP